VPWAAAASRVSSVCSRRVFLKFQDLADAREVQPVGGPRRRVAERPVPPGHPQARPLPDEQAALKVLYLVIAIPQKNRANVTGSTPGWKPP
jgi:hypothetical protein